MLCAFPCFIVVSNSSNLPIYFRVDCWRNIYYPYSAGLIQWHGGNASGMNLSEMSKYTRPLNITTTIQSTTKPCAYIMGLLSDMSNCELRMRRECRECFHRHRGLAIPTCITVRPSRTCRDACRGRFPLTSVVGKTFPAFSAHAHPAIVRI